MNPVRSFVYALALLTSAGPCNCSSAPQPPPRQPAVPPAPSPRAASQPVSATSGTTFEPPPAFPWPQETIKPLDENSCSEPEKRVRAGLALEADIWMSMICEIDRIKPEKVDDFVNQVRALIAKIPKAYREFPSNRLPKELTDTLSEADKKELGSSVVLYADGKAIERNEQLKTFHDLGSGKIRGWLCIPWDTTRGHAEVTREVLDREMPAIALTFTTEAKELLADASQDVDIFDWENMSGHGQTPTKSSSDMAAIPDATAQAAWVKFIDEYIGKSVQQCTAAAKAPAGSDAQKKAVQRALYFLGYSLHAVEDVASHRGRTNPEHSYNAHEGHNPDEAEISFTLARDMTGKFLVHVLTSGKLKDCAQRLRSYEGPQIGYSEKGLLLGKSRDLTAASILAYKFSYKKFNPGSANQKVRWFPDTVEACATDQKCNALLARVTP